MINVRDNKEYIRYLELISIVSEDWGKVVKSLNDFAKNEWDENKAKETLDLLTRMQSPINELKGKLALVK